MDGLPGALATAGLALLAKIAFDEWARIRERQAIASAVAGEIAAYMQMLHPKQTARSFRSIGALDAVTRGKRLAALPSAPTGHPVFDKVAEKIGRLPAQEASDISAFYNIITGFRIHLSRISSSEFAQADDEYQLQLIEFLATILDQSDSAYNLVQRLDWIANQSSWSMFRRKSVPNDLPNTLPRKQSFNLMPG